MLADFAASSTGRLLGAVAERYGLDPAGDLGLDDDVLALNYRIAVAAQIREEAEPERSPFEEAREATEQMRREMT